MAILGGQDRSAGALVVVLNVMMLGVNYNGFGQDDDLHDDVSGQDPTKEEERRRRRRERNKVAAEKCR